MKQEQRLCTSSRPPRASARIAVRCVTPLLVVTVVLAGGMLLHGARLAAARDTAIIFRPLVTETPTATALATPTSTPMATSTAPPAVPATLVVAPNTGPAGTMVSLSGLGFAREADLATNVTSFTLDGQPLAPPTVVLCPPSATYPTGTFGFGTLCDPSKPYTPVSIPTTATPGEHNFVLVITTGQSAAGAPGSVVVHATAVFTVVALPTATFSASPSPSLPTATATSTPTPAAATATSTGTAAAATATVTLTVTPTLAASTATGTGTPAVTAATAASTSTPRPTTPVRAATPTAAPRQHVTAAPVVVLVRPELAFGVLAIIVRAAPHEKVHIATTLATDGGKAVVVPAKDGITNSAGLYPCNVKILILPATYGVVTLKISETGTTGSTRVAAQTYRYWLSG